MKVLPPIGSIALFSADESCVQPFCRHRVFLLLGRHEFWRLGGRHCWLARALVVAAAPRRRRDSFVLRRRIGGGHRAGSVRGSSEERSTAATETHLDSLLLGGGAFECGWTLESDRNSADVEIRSDSSGGRALRAFVVDVLHSERNRSRARSRGHWQELLVDHRGGGLVTRSHFRVGAWDYAAFVDSPRLIVEADLGSWNLVIIDVGLVYGS